MFDIYHIRHEKLFEENNIDKKKQAYIYKALLKFTQKGKDDNENYYLNPSLISLKFDASHSWYKCPNCGTIFDVLRERVRNIMEGYRV